MAKTVIGLYESMSEAQQVVNELVRAGYDRNQISLVANDREGKYAQTLDKDKVEADSETEAPEDAAKGAVAGGILGGIIGVVLGLGALAIPGIGPAIAAGPIISGLIGAGVGAAGGGLLGALVGMGIPKEEAGYYAEGVRRGGTIVAVNARDDQVEHASDIMERHGPINVEERAAEWRGGGWTGYDPNAEPHSTTSEPYYESEHLRPVDEKTTVREDRTTGEKYPTGERKVGRSAVRVHTYYEDEPTTQRSHTLSESDLEVFEDPHGYSIRDRHPELYATHESDFRSHFNQHYASSGGLYSEYEPAYQFGSNLTDYRGRRWEDVEPAVRQQWESEHKGTWEKFKDSIRYAWNKL